jgi:Tfp pilus assembly protein PilN
LIEINLLPGSARRSKRRLPKFALGGPFAKLPAFPKFDKNLAILVGSWVVGVGLILWMFIGARARKAELEDQIVAAVADSIRLAAIIASTDTLTVRMNVVAQKLTVVQEIDQSRYTWSHIMDEVARALPSHVWLRGIANLPVDSGVKYPRFRIEGRAGNNFALTQYLEQLESSPFVRGVRLLRSEMVREEDKLVYAFELEAGFEQPPPDLIETVPLFTRIESEADTTVDTGRGAPAAAPPPSARTPARRPGTEEPR